MANAEGSAPKTEEEDMAGTPEGAVVCREPRWWSAESADRLPSLFLYVCRPFSNVSDSQREKESGDVIRDAHEPERGPGTGNRPYFYLHFFDPCVAFVCLAVGGLEDGSSGLVWLAAIAGLQHPCFQDGYDTPG